MDGTRQGLTRPGAKPTVSTRAGRPPDLGAPGTNQGPSRPPPGEGSHPVLERAVRPASAPAQQCAAAFAPGPRAKWGGRKMLGEGMFAGRIGMVRRHPGEAEA